MSSIYLNNFYKNAERFRVLEIIDNLQSGDSLQHYLNRFVTESQQQSPYIDWKRRYVSSNYIDTILREYTDYVQVVKKTTDFPKTGRFPKKKKDALEVFYRNNNWESLIRNIAFNRKKYGDVYLHWFIDVDIKTGKEYPKFILLDSKYMDIKLDQNKNIFAYVYEEQRSYEYEVLNGQFGTKTKTVKWVFKRGQVDIYENGVLFDTIQNRNEYMDLFPLIHLQFMVNIEDMYSIVPSESLIDPALDLDRIETDIARINTMMGAPQLYIVDGKIDSQNSGFGPNSIVYVDSIVHEDELGKTFQAKVEQLEITNDLKSLYLEKSEKVELIYSKSNLISPKEFQLLARSNSSKVMSSARKDLENELRSFYDELGVKFAPMFTVLYSLANIKLGSEEHVTIGMPEYIIDETVYDKYMLKSQKMNLGELTIQGNLRDVGMTDTEIKSQLKEINEEMLNGQDDVSIVTAASKVINSMGAKSTAPNSTTGTNGNPGLDNNMKKV